MRKYWLYNIAKKKPDFVVSGVNIGKNIGVGFSLLEPSACIEANISGVPAIALSQEFFPKILSIDTNRRFSENTQNTLFPT